MQNHNGKTKTAMLLELESIKDLLLEDDIPILQEVVSQPGDLTLVKSSPADALQLPDVDILVLPVAVTPDVIATDLDISQKPQTEDAKVTVEPRVEIQENLFEPVELLLSNDSTNEAQPSSVTANEIVATEVVIDTLVSHIHSEQQDFFDLTTLGKLPAATSNNYTGIKVVASSAQTTPLSLNDIKPASSRQTPKTSGQNPFLPEHIRARLNGNNPSSGFNNSAVNNVANGSKTKNRSNLFQSTTNNLSASFARKSVASQQQLIDELIDYMLPNLEHELRGRLEKLSQKALEDLLAESK